MPYRLATLASRVPVVLNPVQPQPNLRQLDAHLGGAPMSCTLTHSSGPWMFCIPVKMLGVGTPISVRREPSVPPRIGCEKVRRRLAAGLARQLDRAHVVLQPVAHVAILRRDLAGDVGARLGGSNRGADLLDQIALRLQPVALEVAQDEVQFGCRGRAAHLVDVDEPLASGGGLRRQRHLRQRVDDLGRQVQGVDQLVLGVAGVDRDALNACTVALSAEKVS